MVGARFAVTVQLCQDQAGDVLFHGYSLQSSRHFAQGQVHRVLHLSPVGIDVDQVQIIHDHQVQLMLAVQHHASRPYLRQPATAAIIEEKRQLAQFGCRLIQPLPVTGIHQFKTQLVRFHATQRA